MKILLGAAVLAVGLLASPGVNAAVIAECGSSKGYAYFYPSFAVAESEAGFTEDALSAGSTSIVTIEGKFDVLFTDASGSTQSSLSQGANIFPVGPISAEGFLVLIVAYPSKTVEIYSYHAPTKILTLLQHRYGGIITASKLMVSSCW